MEMRQQGWWGDPLLHLMLIAVILACLGLWRMSSQPQVIGADAYLISGPTDPTLAPPSIPGPTASVR